MNIQLKYLVIFFTFLTPTFAVSNEDFKFNFAPFALYEHASDRITLSNVSTRYGIGAAGLEIKANNELNDQTNVFLRLGAGYHPSYSLNSFGTEFTGPVNGILFEYGIELDTSPYIFRGSGIEIKTSNRKVFSDQLTGTRSGTNFTTSTDARMVNNEIRLKQSFELNNENKLTIFMGINNWNLNATGTAYSSDFTVKKKVKGSNSDPVWGVNYSGTIFNRLFDFGFTHRTISADNKVETYEIFGALDF